MANEIKLSVVLNVKNGFLKYDFQPGTQNITQTNAEGPTPGFLTIGTSEESEAFSELTALGYVVLRNLDATNFVQVGFATGVYGIRLKPGEVNVFRLEPSTTLYLKADTAACKVQVLAFGG